MSVSAEGSSSCCDDLIETGGNAVVSRLGRSIDHSALVFDDRNILRGSFSSNMKL